MEYMQCKLAKSILPAVKRVHNSEYNFFSYKRGSDDKKCIVYFKDNILQDIQNGVERFQTTVIKTISGGYQIFVASPKIEC